MKDMEIVCLTAEARDSVRWTHACDTQCKEQSGAKLDLLFVAFFTFS